MRWILVNLIIVPIRAPRSANRYRKIWNSEGSPLLQHTKKLAEKVQRRAGNQVEVIPLMRYGQPSLSTWLKQEAPRFEKIIFLPLYPHYSGSTTGTVEALIRKQLDVLRNPPRHTLIRQFWDHPGYLDAMQQLIESTSPKDYDHVVFSYHGLPVRQVQKGHPGLPVGECDCTEKMTAFGSFCYMATCYASTRKLTSALSLPQSSVTTTFQSRLSRNWLSPFTDEVLCKLAGKMSKRVLLIPMSFVADNLETIEELNIEYRKKFLQCGGGELVVASCLNENEIWVNAVQKLFLTSSI
jgi:ferrochelatase